MRFILIIRKWRHEPVSIAYILVFLYLLFIILFAKSNDSIKIESSFKNVDTTRNGKEVCALPIYDFWHESVKPLLKGHNPMKNCDKTFRKWTELENGEWRVLKEGANCSARCFEGIGAKKEVVFQEWMKPGKTSCEFIEAVCWENNTEAYGYTHSQIIPRQPPETKFPTPPNVLVFTIDSLNTGMAKRSLPKFIQYFHAKFSGIEFPFVNKVGENSQPNGFPLWFGKRIEGGRTVAWDELKPDWNETEYCERFLDNETHIFKEFKQHGYATALIEDWYQTLLDAWPFCNGFKERPADHGFRPLTSVYEAYGMKVTRYHLKGKLCRETHHAAMEYLEQLMNAYQDRPLFAWTWLNNIAHNFIDGPARVDDYLVEYFERNHQILDDSFVLFVADHGLRFGYGNYFTTEIGSFERHNPYLAISVPRKYRGSETGLLDILRKNSKQLQTHFDTRATLLDILKFQPMFNFTQRDHIKIPNEIGDSLIRRQPEWPRTCATLPIPQQYCICQVQKWEIRNKILQRNLGKKLVDHVHHLLAKTNVSQLCERYDLEEVTSLIEYDYTKSWNTYKISAKTTFSAHFETLMVYNDNDGSVNFGKVVRLDTYGNTADCTEKVKFQALCHCKK
ncbi:hypothetical protein B9Z55_016136 [Caenorhabditis nigoni]|uniref:Uncharacterized protein n=2 Tax=Caenorhabditis nigoni TaxID=1611254 RepID=A0A2G5UDB5_9PELO|nr:hypothetical protein B9Z55_016136 [Caenorhabditis nigoni]